ncbi:MAG TPA: APC family permease [Actinomycetota bacterium]
MANVALKRALVGRPLASHKAEHQLLPKTLALPVFSSDPLSSNAYATEEMTLVLVTAGAGALAFRIPIAIAIATVLTIVVVSYRQTVRAYPNGGGSYIVAHENLGVLPGLVAAAALLTDYVLTVSVSVVAGFNAISSAAPSLSEHRVLFSIGLVVLLTLANLRGVKEAGTFFAIPTYGFVAMVYVMLGTGIVRCLDGCPRASTADLPLEETAAISIFLILRAFSSGATALTGVEAISNGVQAFRRPQAKNAATTLAMMAVMTVTMFIGITIFSVLLDVRVNEHIAATRSVLSQIGETIFGRSLPYFLLQGLTAGILVLAANTAYQDFPRLSAILARDRFMPSQFRNRGDRLVFSNGVVILAIAASALIAAFDANLTRLIQLYVIGVFTAFTLSQLGMVRHWRRVREPGWRRSIVINGFGAAATGIVLVIVTMTKFAHGAWIVIAAMPVIILFFLAVHRHYAAISRALEAELEPPVTDATNRFVLLVSDLGPATAEAVGYVRAARPDDVVPLYVGPQSSYGGVADAWGTFAPRLGPLRALDVRGGVAKALRSSIRELREASPVRFLTVVIPEEIRGRSLLRHLGRGSRFWLKAALFFETDVVVTDVPLVAEEAARLRDRGRPPLEPTRHVVLVPVSGVHAATGRAVSVALSLEAAEREAIFFSTETSDQAEIAGRWIGARMLIPLSIVDAPFRDLSDPMLAEVRRHTRQPGTVVTVVLPELIVAHWWEHLLHNQTSLFFKRLLLFEPDVVVTSVPTHVRHLEAPPAGAPSGLG